MNVLLLLILLLILGSLIAYVQLSWAWANYPKSSKWLFLRFGSSFLSGALLGLFLFYRDFYGIELVLAVLMTSFGSGIIFTYGFAYNMQHLIPKQNKSDEDKEGK